MSKRNPPRKTLGARPTKGPPELSKSCSRDPPPPPPVTSCSSSSRFHSSRSSSVQVSSRSHYHHHFNPNRNPPNVQKSLEVPHVNSTRSQEKLIEKAIRDISKLPEKIEEVVSRKVSEVEFQKSLTHKAAKKLNVPKSGRIYHDLLDIETVAPIAVKRPPSFEPKPVDPTPSIMDYNKAEYSRSRPPEVFPLPISSKKNSRPSLIELDLNFNPNDLLGYERIYSSL